LGSAWEASVTKFKRCPPRIGFLIGDATIGRNALPTVDRTAAAIRLDKMLEITADDIANLADDDLRALVAHLCEAEMRRRSLPVAAVTWGGDQNAADGGIDVRVALPPNTVIDGFVPRPETGFQVKKSDMPPGSIVEEMSPGGGIRPSIQALADAGGAYIIVSSNGSTSDSALRDRRDAMAGAVRGAPNGANLKLDFFDRNRIASWVRDNPGLVPWVRRLAGRPISGWQSYGPWANPAEDVSAEYLADEGLRIRTGKKGDNGGLKAVVGLNRIREALSMPGGIVRLVGLSGVGKTRFVQALFDERIGEGSLDPAQALYANMNDGPDPPPVAMVTELAGLGSRAVVVIDNCAHDLHRRLSEIVRASDSRVSLVTVEYDIEEDQPELTDVYKMEPASNAMIEKLVRMRFPVVSQVAADRIADFSGGNARIAIALAATVDRGDNISALADADLFERLFQQRHSPDPGLLSAAKALSLVYSFDGEDVSDAGELARLGQFAGLDAAALYKQVVELQRRDLVQARSHWRAVLPHAVANRLASLALEDNPPSAIEMRLVATAPDRIKKSFSRRLGFLNDKPEAVRIVEKWLEQGGLLGDVAQLDQQRAEMFANVAPVAPEKALAAIERVPAGKIVRLDGERRSELVRLLRSLAYDSDLFERSVKLLVALAEGDRDDTEARRAVESLFFAYLSGTHATIGQRLGVMNALVKSKNPPEHRLGLDVLASLLEATHFSSSYDFLFGSQSRDFGYHPSFAEVQNWYSEVLAAAESLLTGAREVAGTIASKFRGLWSQAQMYEALEHASAAIAANGFWREGWIAVKQTLQYDGSAMSPDVKERLVDLEKKLRPKGLVEKVRSIVLSQSGKLDLDEYEEEEDDEEASGWKRMEVIAGKLGEEAAVDDKGLSELLPEIVSGPSPGRLLSFGRGLARGAADLARLWERLVEAFSATVEELRNASVLGGFLQTVGERNPPLAGALLDAALEHPILGKWFVVLQTSVEIDPAAVARLHRALDLGVAPVESFVNLAFGRAHEPILGADLKDLTERIAEEPGGLSPSMRIVFFRLFGDKEKRRQPEPEIIAVGRIILRRLEFGTGFPRDDYELGLIIEKCASGLDGVPVARDLCRRFKKAADQRPSEIFHHHALFESLCKVQGATVLDTFFAGDESEWQKSARLIGWLSARRNPLDAIPANTLLAWCAGEPEVRFPRMASVISFLRGPEENAASEWSDVARRMLKGAPDKVAVARQFAARFPPSSWSGSRAAIMENRSALLDELVGNEDPDLAAFAVAEKTRLANLIDAERNFETASDREIDERFE
jgi:hypothetical protein